jgi:hypothetical protein
LLSLSGAWTLSQTDDTAVHETLEKAWRQFDQATARIQALLLGRAIMDNDGLLRRRLIRRFGDEFGGDQKDLITLGSRFLDFEWADGSVRHDEIVAVLDSLQAAMDRLEEREHKALLDGQRCMDPALTDALHQLNLVEPAAWHQFYRQVFQSRASGGWMWRGIMSDAFERLVAGGRPVLFRDPDKKVHGKPLELEYYKRLAVLHVYFLAGKGAGIDACRRKVAEALEISFERLKTWSDRLRKDPRGQNDMECARLAGKIGREFYLRKPEEFEKFEQYGFFDGVSKLVFAERIFSQLTENPIVLVRGKILHSKQKTAR